MFRVHASNVPADHRYARYFETAQGRFIPKTKREAKTKPRDDEEIQGQEE